jgi:hypothetical protein
MFTIFRGKPLFPKQIKREAPEKGQRSARKNKLIASDYQHI